MIEQICGLQIARYSENSATLTIEPTVRQTTAVLKWLFKNAPEGVTIPKHSLGDLMGEDDKIAYTENCIMLIQNWIVFVRWGVNGQHELWDIDLTSDDFDAIDVLIDKKIDELECLHNHIADLAERLEDEQG